MPFPSKRHLSGKKNGSLRRCAEELRRAQQLHEQLPPRISCDLPSLIAVDRPAREPEARTMASHGWATAARLFPHEAVVAEEGSSVSTLQCRTPPLACGVSRSVPPSLEAMSACSYRHVVSFLDFQHAILSSHVHPYAPTYTLDPDRLRERTVASVTNLPPSFGTLTLPCEL